MATNHKKPSELSGCETKQKGPRIFKMVSLTILELYKMDSSSSSHVKRSVANRLDFHVPPDLGNIHVQFDRRFSYFCSYIYFFIFYYFDDFQEVLVTERHGCRETNLAPYLLVKKSETYFGRRTFETDSRIPCLLQAGT